MRGFTYKFIQTHSSNVNNTIRFSTTNQGTHSGGVQYSDGYTDVGDAGQSGAYVLLKVSINAPSTLYYYSIGGAGYGNGGSIKIMSLSEGTTGSIGAQGVQGATGFQGYQGYQGFKGEPGEGGGEDKFLLMKILIYLLIISKFMEI